MTSRSIRPAVAVLSLIAALAAARAAHGSTFDGDTPTNDLVGHVTDVPTVAVPRAEGDHEGARLAVDTLSRDLEVSGFFDILTPAAYPSRFEAEGMGFSSTLWAHSGALAVVKMKASGTQLEGRLFVVARGDTAVLTRTYGADELRQAVHAFGNDILQALTGVQGVFGSRIAFAQAGHGSHEIAAVDVDGGRLAVLTKMQSDCLLPAFSPAGDEIAFTSYLRDNPDLWIVSAGGGRARRTSKQPGMNTGAAWSPDGGAIALTLSHQGNSDLYLISPVDGTIKARLTDNPTIESSPTFSPDGSRIAFVSNRLGSPQIFVMGAAGGGIKRVTYQGKYNQTPRWNPDPKKTQIAYTGQDERGAFDVFFIDLTTQRITRVTQGRGSNKDPAWSPDGRLLVYASSRGGLFVNNPETHREHQITKGAVASPSWGPAPKH